MNVLRYRITHPDIKNREWFVTFSKEQDRETILKKFRTIHGIVTNDGESFSVELWDTRHDPFDKISIEHARNMALLEKFNII